jgi:hypothetical protein
MSTLAKFDPLAESFEGLETHLELPYISGELNRWGADVEGFLQKAGEQLHEAVKREHPKNYEAITASRPDLSAEVGKMRDNDAALLSALQTVREQVDRFRATVREDQLAEQQFLPARNRLVDEVLNFVLQVRKQRAAVTTWMSEALQRDNGVGD